MRFFTKEQRSLLPALGAFLLGVVILLAAPEEIPRKAVSCDADAFRAEGGVERVSEMNGSQRLTVRTEELLDITAFVERNLSLRPGIRVKVEGRSQLWRGRQQLIADRITLLP